MIPVECLVCGDSELDPADILLQKDATGEGLAYFYCPICSQSQGSFCDADQVAEMEIEGVESFYGDKGAIVELICDDCDDFWLEVSEMYILIFRDNAGTMESHSEVFYDCPSCQQVKSLPLDEEYLRYLLTKGANFHYSGSQTYDLQLDQLQEEISKIEAGEID